MASPYNPAAWFWIVAGSETQVYSSAASDYLPVAEPAYVAWLAQGNIPTSIASADELGQVLAEATIRPTNAALLDSYQESHARRLTVEVAAKLFLNLENRLRVLEGKPAVNAGQFRAFVKGLM